MKYIIGGLGIVIVVAIFIAIIIGFVSNGPARDAILEESITLTDYADSRSEVVHTVYGPIVGNEEFRAVRITVNDRERSIEILHGYNLSVQDRQTFSNNTAAYEAFLHAIEGVGYTEVREGQSKTEDGACPTRQRHTYKLRVDDEERLRLWSSRCRDERGTFAGNTRTTERLFQAQIPDYRELIRGVDL